jgi:hypothetical protein
MAIRNSSLQKYRWTRILCSIGFLLLLLSASNSVWSQKTPAANALLAERHKAAGTECKQCHQEKPSSPVPTAVCTGCHGDLTKPSAKAAKKRNPHDAHIPFPDCSDCHHVHKPSVSQCDTCHDFGQKIP